MKFFKWLASFDDRWEAKLFCEKQAQRITGLGIQKEYSVKLERDRDGWHVNLYKQY